MGSAMENFCCANKNDDSIIMQNPNDSTNSTNNSININNPYNKLIPSNKIETGNDLSKIIQVNSKNKDNIPFTDYELIEKLGKGECGEAYIVKNKKNKNILVLKKIKRNKSSNLSEDDISKEIEIIKHINHIYILRQRA